MSSKRFSDMSRQFNSCKFPISWKEKLLSSFHYREAFESAQLRLNLRSFPVQTGNGPCNVLHSGKNWEDFGNLLSCEKSGWNCEAFINFHHKRKSFKEYKKWFFAFFYNSKEYQLCLSFLKMKLKRKRYHKYERNFLEMHRSNIQTFWIEDPFTLFSNFLSIWYLY